MSKRELPTPGGSPFLFVLCWLTRSPRSGVVPLHGFLYGPAHKGVYRLSTGLCVDIHLMSDYEWHVSCLKSRLENPEVYREMLGEDVEAVIDQLRATIAEYEKAVAV